MRNNRTSETIRARIRADLPTETFARQPQRAMWFVPLVAAVVLCSWFLIERRPPWYAAVPIAVLIGHAYAAMGFLAHEALHGSLLRSRRISYVLGVLGLGPFLVSPSLWLVWHVRVHHANANHAEGDPDTFGTLDFYERSPETRFITRLAPGSGHPASALFPAYWFTFHGQIVLWFLSRRLKGFEDLDRTRAVTETIAFATCWLLLALAAGPTGSIFVIVIPHVVSNAPRRPAAYVDERSQPGVDRAPAL